MCKGDEHKDELELEFSCFVMKQPLREQCAESAAYQCQQVEGVFGDSRSIVCCTAFVNAVHAECYKADQSKIKPEEMVSFYRV